MLFTGFSRSLRCELPTSSPGSSKYGEKKAMTLQLETYGFRQEVLRDLQHAVSHSVAEGTWAGYKSAERLLAEYCKAENLPLDLPVSEKVVIGFVHWLAYHRKLKAGTINGYLAGIRKLHVVKGVPCPNLRNELVKLILEGRKNIETGNKLRDTQTKKERQPFTTDTMRLLKIRIKAADMDPADKITVWCASSLLYHGACRGGELLCKSEKEFDPAFTLLKSDIALVNSSGTESIQLRLKMPKEVHDSRAVIIDIFATGTGICPVAAAKKWAVTARNQEEGMPAFLLKSGKPLTTNRLNHIIKERFLGYLESHNLTVHSFRTGAASGLAAHGASTDDIKNIGRWSSRAYKSYVKMPRVMRQNAAQEVGADSWFRR